MSHRMAKFSPHLTFTVDLPGGKERLRQIILYVSRECLTAPRFGGIKLNKIIWRADFESFAARGKPVTGRPYQRLKLGPAPKEMLPTHRDMLNEGLIEISRIDFGDGVVEQRTVPVVEPQLDLFDETDLQFVDDSIRYYWGMTGVETSDESHGIAWRTRSDGDPMPYESAYLSDRKLTAPQLTRMKKMIYDKGWISD